MGTNEVKTITGKKIMADACIRQSIALLHRKTMPRSKVFYFLIEKDRAEAKSK